VSGDVNTPERKNRKSEGIKPPVEDSRRLIVKRRYQHVSMLGKNDL
jgi:hypothetical protein